MIPTRFLPPPKWKKILVFFLILLGHLPFIRRGFWFYRIRDNELFWNPQEMKEYGMTASSGGIIGTYDDLFSAKLWDDSDRQHVKKSIEVAMKSREVFTNQFCVKHQTTGELIVMRAKGWWLFDSRGEPWALWGWNHAVKLPPDKKLEKIDDIKLRQDVDRMKQSGVSPRLLAALSVATSTANHF